MRAWRHGNPRLIHCSILAFGRGGRYYNRPAYDPIIQSLSGVAGTLARATGEPRFVPMVMSDHTSGLIAAQAIGFALYRREKTGQGEAIEVPMLENMALVRPERAHGRRAPSIRRSAPPATAAAAQPGLSAAADQGRLHHRPAQHQRQAFAFFDAIGRPELKTDPRFNSAAVAHRQRRRLFRGPQGGLAQKTTAEWLEIFDKLDVPAARYNSIDDLLTDPHLKDVGFFKEEDHPSQGPPAHAACQHVLRRCAEKRDPRPADGRANSRDPGRSRLRPAEIEALVLAAGAAS